MLVWLLAFGVLVGITAAVFAFSAGASPLMALLIYASGGSLGLLTMALSFSLRPRPRR